MIVGRGITWQELIRDRRREEAGDRQSTYLCLVRIRSRAGAETQEMV